MSNCFDQTRQHPRVFQKQPVKKQFNMPRYRRNNYDLQDLRVGDEIIWNEREETAEVINVDAPFEDDPNHPMHKRTTVTVETVRGTEYDLFQNEMSGDEVKRASSYDKEPLRYVEIV